MAINDRHNLTPEEVAALRGHAYFASGPQIQPMSLMTWVAASCLVGTCVGLAVGGPWLWLAFAVVLLAAAPFASSRPKVPARPAFNARLSDVDQDELTQRPIREQLRVFLGRPLSNSLKLLVVAAGLLAASRGAYHGHYLANNDIGRYTSGTAQLAKVEGVIVDEPGFTDPDRGAFADFGYRPPATLFVLDVSRMQVGNDWQDVQGRLLVRVKMADHRLQQGDRIRTAGWLGAIGGPLNPGDFDHRLRFDRMGIRGRLSVAEASGVEHLDQYDPASWLATFRSRIADEAARSLNVGIESDDPELGLLRALLLGKRDSISRDTQDAFKETGLAHLLAISGAHLAILMFLTWSIVRLVSGRPRVTAAIVLAVLGVYLLMIPWTTPITRAGIMAAAFTAGELMNRPIRALDSLSAAGVFLLLIDPGQAYDAGFQLSFGIVISLMLFTRPISLLIWPIREPELAFDGEYQLGGKIMRFGSDYLGANIVAFFVATPLVSYHFQLITPFAVFLSLLALPVVVGVLSIGYVKILLGLLIPSGALLLADLLLWCSQTLSDLVHRASDWPGSVVRLDLSPPIVWVLFAEVVVFVMLAGWLRHRRLVQGGLVATCVVWLAMSQPQVQRWPHDVVARSAMLRSVVPVSIVGEQPAARVSMFAVGDGSCILVQIFNRGGGRPFNLMFDCGSQQYLDLGTTSIAPSLSSLGIDQIDLMALSHADIDHFGGALDVADEVPVLKVIVPPQLLAEAERHPRGATRFLIDGLRERRIAIEQGVAGWQAKLGNADAKLLWPRADFVPKGSANDGSLVMRIEIAGRTILLCGDVQQQAMAELAAAGALVDADIAELPHHGSHHEMSEAWVTAGSPEIVMQSCGRSRMHLDKWEGFFAASPITRLVTAESGMVQAEIAVDGELTHRTFLAADPGGDDGPPF